jgi:hypothetical protein
MATNAKAPATEAEKDLAKNYNQFKEWEGQKYTGMKIGRGHTWNYDQDHWYILAHQKVRKLDANTYTTSLSGLKYKLAHRRADKEKWNISEKAQRRRLINLLKGIIDGLEHEEIEPISNEIVKQKSE